MCAKSVVSSIILTSSRQGGNFTPPLQPPQNVPLKSTPRLGLMGACWSRPFRIGLLTEETFIGNNMWQTAIGYGCSFVAKPSWKKELFYFWKNICVFYKIYIICRKKMFLYGKKVLYWKIFLLKRNFFVEKNINENVKNICHLKNSIFIQKMFVI